MTITSTEFQQNVGYYLKQAEQGKTITIERLKPKKSSYKLVANKPSAKTEKKLSRREEVRRMIEEFNIRNSEESGLEFQHRVRS